MKKKRATKKYFTKQIHKKKTYRYRKSVGNYFYIIIITCLLAHSLKLTQAECSTTAKLFPSCFPATYTTSFDAGSTLSCRSRNYNKKRLSFLGVNVHKI